MNKRDPVTLEEITAQIVVTRARGMSTAPARELSWRIRELDCNVTIENGNGRVADARDILQLLMLEVGNGETITVHCSGVDAEAAAAVVAEILGGKDGEAT